MGIINTTRELLAVDLRSYGEDELADKVPQLTDAEMARIGELAFTKSCAPDGASLLSKALALAAVEILEGHSRDLRWKRRKLKATRS